MLKNKQTYGIVLVVNALLSLTLSLPAQESPERVNFAAPLDIPLILSGNFAEIRSNHLHGGLDFKTNSQSGYRVYAIESGYIYRIKIQAGGYGRAIYIRHPNGYHSVYAHLLQFRADIEEFTKAHQYQKQEFAVDIFLGEQTFPLAKGDYFALSGNTGSSQAPHLHFEIRDGQTENPVNPLHFDFQVKDRRAPVLKSLTLYSLTGRKDLKPKVRIPLQGGNGQYSPVIAKAYPLDQLAGVGVYAIEYLDEADNPCGIYQLDMLLDGELHFKLSMDEFSFSESRYINSLIDYEAFMKDREQVIKAFIEPNNHLSTYEFARNEGRLALHDTVPHELTIRVQDVHGNTSQARLMVRLDPGYYANQDFSQAYYAAYFPFAETNRFDSQDFELYMGPNTLYDDLYFRYETHDPPPGTYSNVHEVHHPYVPLHRSMTLWIRAEVPEKLRKHAVAARVRENGRLAAAGGVWEGDRMKIQTSSFGSFVVTVDTIAPVITPLSPVSEAGLRAGRDIRFRIRDDFSGISSYRATVNGAWVLFEYDPKTATISHKTDPDIIPAGTENELILRVSDQAGNTSVYKNKLIR